ISFQLVPLFQPINAGVTSWKLVTPNLNLTSLAFRWKGLGRRQFFLLGYVTIPPEGEPIQRGER
ncbi:MAG: hypothetical protein ACRD82_17980, partial [Blastocatellia bacterium]